MSNRPIPSDIPAEALPFLEEVAYFAPDALAPGATAPDVPLLDPLGHAVRSVDLWADRPVVLIFGSYT